MTRWYRLLGVDEFYDEENPLGEIELSVQWIHDPRAKDIATRKLSLLQIVQRTLGKVSTFAVVIFLILDEKLLAHPIFCASHRIASHPLFDGLHTLSVFEVNRLAWLGLASIQANARSTWKTLKPRGSGQFNRLSLDA